MQKLECRVWCFVIALAACCVSLSSAGATFGTACAKLPFEFNDYAGLGKSISNLCRVKLRLKCLKHVPLSNFLSCDSKVG